MPALLLERLPLPSFQVYGAFSVVMLAVALLYTHHTVVTLQEAPIAGIQSSETEEPPEKTFLADNSASLVDIFRAVNISLPYDQYKLNFLYVFSSESWCIWTIVNIAYCLLILLGKLIQAIVFGELRVSEQQHLKDKFWNFVFYKFIFIFGVMNVQTMEEVVLWVAWFTCLGFLHLLTQLSKDRFEYLSFSPTTPRKAHAKLLGLLALLLMSTGGLLGVCVSVAFRFGITIFAFMAAECVLLGLKASYVVIRYMIHLWDLNMEGVWENRSVYIYYTELIFELLSLFVDFFHHLHMLLWGNIFLSMASLVICMQLRYLFYEFQRRVKRHKNYLRVVKNMQARFPMASQEDLEQNADDCAICWERMDSARKLPCGHLFHNACLRSWLEQDTSCPTCRMTLSERPESWSPAADIRGAPPNPNMADAGPNVPPGTTNHFFHFDGSRYVSWLPSFSVEVTHTSILPGQQLRLQTSQLDNMLRQVQAVFPNYPQSAILEDLRQTRSVDITIDNILEGRILPGTTVTNLASLRDDNFNGVNATAPTEPTSLSPVPQTAQKTLQTGLLQLPQQLPASNEITFSREIEAHTTSEASQRTETEQSASSAINAEDAAGGSSHTQGGRFSKSSSERMAMLQERKNIMLEQARRRYLSRHSEDTGDDSLSSGESSLSLTSLPRANFSSMDEERARRRELMLQATQRRLINNS